jgi:type IV secretion system protein VirD4
MDEFTAAGKIEIISTSNAFIAGYGLRLLTIFQSVGQVEQFYEKEGARTVLTNHGCTIVYPPREQRDANEVSEMLGYFTEKSHSTSYSGQTGILTNPGTLGDNVSDQRRALMMPQELREMEQDEEIVIVDGCRPIRCNKSVYYKDRVFMDRLSEVSPSLAKLGRRLPSQAELEDIAFKREELAIRVPVLNFDLIRAQAENRVRVAPDDEPIPVDNMVIDMNDIPVPANQAEPDAQDIEQLVDAFFSQYEWKDSNDSGISIGAPAGDGDGNNGGGLVSMKGIIDLSVLEL